MEEEKSVREIRNTLRGLEARSDSWVHPDGRTVQVIGAMHLAPSKFYDKVTEEINKASASGSVIHLERTHSPKDLDALSAHDREVYDLMQKDKADMIRVATAIGLVHQGQSMDDIYNKFGATDVTFEEMAPSVDLNKLRKSQEGESIGDILSSGSPSLRRIGGTIILAILHIMPIMKELLGERLNEASFLDRSVILDYRNRYAIDQVLESDAPHHLLFWGAAHLNGMGTLLSEAGFKRTKSKWNLILPWSHRLPRQAKNG